MKKPLFLFFGLFCLFSQTAAQDKLQDKFNESVSREVIEISGVYQLSDFLKFSNSSYSYSLDDFRWYSLHNNLSFNSGKAPVIFINGKKIDARVFSLTRLNYLPLNVNSIDSVEFFNVPGIYFGEFINSSAINFVTKKAEDKTVIYAGVTAGNETGDPGPFKFTDEATRNVDQIGPEYYAGVYGGKGKFGYAADFKNNYYSTTDEVLFERTPSLRWEHRILNLTALSGRGSYTGDNWSHNIFAGYSFNSDAFAEGHFTSDLMYFDFLATEIPMDVKMFNAGYEGKYRINKRYSLKYYAKYSENSADPGEQFDGPAIFWKTKNYYGRASVNSETEKTYSEVSYVFENNEFVSPYDVKNRSAFLHSLNFSHERNLGLLLKAGAQAGITYGKSYASLKAAINGLWKIDKTALAFSASYTETPPGEYSASLGQLASNGYPLYDLAGSPSGQIKVPGEYRLYTADLMITLPEYAGISSKIKTFYRKLENYPFYDISYMLKQEADFIKTEELNYLPDNGEAAGFEAGFEYKGENYFIGSAYVYNGKLSGGSLFGDTFSIIPEHRVNLYAGYKPLEKLTLYGYYRYQTATRWEKFEEIARNDEVYDSSPGPFHITGVNIRYLFWSKKLHADLMFRNLLNERINLHPLGGSVNFSLIFKLSLNLELSNN